MAYFVATVWGQYCEHFCIYTWMYACMYASMYAIMSFDYAVAVGSMDLYTAVKKNQKTKERERETPFYGLCFI